MVRSMITEVVMGPFFENEKSDTGFQRKLLGSFPNKYSTVFFFAFLQKTFHPNFHLVLV